MRQQILLVILAMLTVPAAVLADDDPGSAKDRAAILAAAGRGLSLVQEAAARYPEHRKCFSCHHQTLPMLAIAEAQQAGLKADAGLLKSQWEFTAASLESRIDQLRQAQQIGGRAATVTYALWTLEIAGQEPGELSAAMISYLLQTQEQDGSWKPQSIRPPLEESRVTCTALAVYAMQRLAGEEQAADVEKSIASARAYLSSAEIAGHEDKVFRLWGLHLLGADDEAKQAARSAVVDAQREDGGWSQLPDMESDAYATGQTLWALSETGTPAASDAFRRGIAFLLASQHEDGSWLVKSRSKPVQVYFDNGDPHGKDQFISTPAAAWAVTALCRALGKSGAN